MYNCSSELSLSHVSLDACHFNVNLDRFRKLLLIELMNFRHMPLPVILARESLSS